MSVSSLRRRRAAVVGSGRRRRSSSCGSWHGSSRVVRSGCCSTCHIWQRANIASRHHTQEHDAEASGDTKRLTNMQLWDHIVLDRTHDPVHTIKTVPDQAHYAIAELRAELAKGANSYSLQASAELNAHARRCLVAFLWFERLMLSNPSKCRSGRRGQKSKSLISLLTWRLRWAWNGSWELLWREADLAIHDGSATCQRSWEDQVKRDTKPGMTDKLQRTQVHVSEDVGLRG